jgi:hypothetical protein
MKIRAAIIKRKKRTGYKIELMGLRAPLRTALDALKCLR